MRRAKLGDVYYIKVPNGYKIFQWAYRIPKKGDFIRVFDGLYQTIPEDLKSIVNSQHSYIIAFYVSRAYRIGMAVFLGNYAVPGKYPFPKYQIRFRTNLVTQKLEAIHVMNADMTNSVWQWYDVNSIEELPTEYRGVTLLSNYLTPNWLLYLFDMGFDLHHPERFCLGDDPEGTLQPYTKIVDSFLSDRGRYRVLTL